MSLHEEFHIDHATLQVEPAEADGACQPGELVRSSGLSR